MMESYGLVATKKNVREIELSSLSSDAELNHTREHGYEFLM